MEHDYRLVALAAVICAAAIFTSFSIYSHLPVSEGARRWVLLSLAGLCCGAGIWSTHFVAMLAYEPGIAVGYEPVATAASLIIAVAATTLGLGLARGRHAISPALGGFAIGGGVAVMHYTGMAALIVPGMLTWSWPLVVASLVLGGGLAAAAMVVYYRPLMRHAKWLAAGLLTLAICTLHFTAMGAVTIVPDPTVLVPQSQIGSLTMAVAVAGVACLVLLAGITATAVMENQARRQREDELSGLNAALAASNKLLDERGCRLQAIIDNFPGGITVLDAGLRLIEVNDKAKRLLELPDHLFANGLPLLEDVFRFNAERGEYGPGQVDEQVATRMTLARAGRAHVFERERPNGTVIEIRGVPIDNGGFVTTYMDMTERRRSEAKIVHMAHHDALTDLPNRVLLRQRLEHALASTARDDNPFAVLMLDLDHFKEINDTLGHAVGDVLLKAVADRLRAEVRSGATIARLGGDEFAILEDVGTTAVEATKLAERLIASVSAPYDLDDHHVTVGVSVGIAMAPGDGKDPDQILKNADLALYGAKGAGRGTYRFFEPAMDARMRARRELEADLRSALVNGQLDLYYQPIFAIDGHILSGFEALLRWHHPERGLVSPAEFIPFAEESGLIVGIGEWVVRAACAEAATWPDHIKIAVNLSAAQFKSAGLVDMVANALMVAGLSADRLELEITETALLENTTATVSAVTRLRALGVRISMDDFGTGYSSLAYLQSFPFDKIKIDRQFIANLSHQSGGLAILKAIARLASSIGVPTVAEGVETIEQLEATRAEGCSEVQGFLFSPARPSSEIKRLFLTTARLEAAA